MSVKDTSPSHRPVWIHNPPLLEGQGSEQHAQRMLLFPRHGRLALFTLLCLFHFHHEDCCPYSGVDCEQSATGDLRLNRLLESGILSAGGTLQGRDDNRDSCPRGEVENELPTLPLPVHRLCQSTARGSEHWVESRASGERRDACTMLVHLARCIGAPARRCPVTCTPAHRPPCQ